jgi:hypothetical protein
MLVTAGATYGLAATPAFGFERLEIRGNVVTPDDAIQGALGVETGTNLVALTTQPIVARLRALPAIRDAAVTVGLPDALMVDITERVAVMIWAVAGHRFAVDETGFLFADVGDGPPPGIAGLPVVTDERVDSAAFAIGSSLDPVDSDAATRIASITPEQIGSHAATLRVIVTDERGFTMTTGPKGWLAVFGKYGRSQRTPALVPGQAQLLAELLKGREDTIDTVILADDRDGTYIPKPTPKPSASPRP